jgi:hypothetical protein
MYRSWSARTTHAMSALTEPSRGSKDEDPGRMALRPRARELWRLAAMKN